jgi:hypothetical protein
MISVTIALPFLKRAPEIAGRRAKANDRDAREDVSPAEDSMLGSPSCGLSRSRASLRLYSEKLELLRGGMVSKPGDAMYGRREAASSAADTVTARRSPWPGGGALIPELTPAVVAGLPLGDDVVFSSVMAEANN